MGMGKKVFFTGASGFLGRNLLEALAKHYPNDIFYVLTRSEATERFLMERFAYLDPDRLKFVRGDITEQDLGIGKEDLDEITSENQEIWALAAATSFDDKKRDEIITTNVQGTRNTISIARGMGSLATLHYFSTAYIGGDFQGIVMEDTMPEVSEFKNSYEESKYESEKAVRESGLPFTIYRPSITLGNSQTFDHGGETRMLYGYILAIYHAVLKNFTDGEEFAKLWLKEKPIDIDNGLRLIGHDETKKIFVCVDDIANQVIQILKSEPVGKTFNLTNKSSITLSEASKCIGEALRIKGLQYVGSEIRDPNSAEKRAMVLTHAYVPYALISDPKWDTTNRDQAVGEYQTVRMDQTLLKKLMIDFVEKEIIRR